MEQAGRIGYAVGLVVPGTPATVVVFHHELLQVRRIRRAARRKQRENTLRCAADTEIVYPIQTGDDPNQTGGPARESAAPTTTWRVADEKFTSWTAAAPPSLATPGFSGLCGDNGRATGRVWWPVRADRLHAAADRTLGAAD